MSENNSFDFCALCGEKVFSLNWRGHMLTKHKMVLSESPQNGDGSWKELSELKPNPSGNYWMQTKVDKYK
jgi:hypothetical protein